MLSYIDDVTKVKNFSDGIVPWGKYFLYWMEEQMNTDYGWLYATTSVTLPL